MSDRADDFDRGVVNRRSVLGDAWVDKSLAGATAFNADFQSLITRYAWNDIWGRPGLEHETRRLLVLGMTMGLARWEEFELHCRAAIEHGVSIEKIKETLMQGAIYCGVPAANTAFKITTDLLRAAGKLPPSQSLAAPLRVASHHTFSAPQIHVTVQGEGPPLVMSHALGLDAGMWDALAARLAAKHTVLRYEHRGHGGSAVPPGPYTMTELVDDAARVIREWGRGPVAWIGLSMGGMVGQGLAIDHPELLRGAVLANTTARYPEAAAATWAARIAAVEQGGMAAVADAVVERYLGPDFRAAHPAEAAALKAKLLRSDPAGYVGCCHAIARVDWLDRLGAVRTPTLVIAGGKDAGATPEMARAIAGRIAGAELVVFEEASHLSVAEEPERFHDTVAGFLASLKMPFSPSENPS
ncbi:MAG: alpha/beta fold hydrolase [Burkholderiales bacterium]|nr:alpha/beta fold hydrolase [Burkholderiales bacterium]